MFDHESHLMQDKNDHFENYRHLNQTNTGYGTIFTCADFSVAIMWNKTSVFLFYSHSRNNQGFHGPNGKATLLEIRSMTSFNNFLETFFIENIGVSAETQYDLQYTAINVSEEKKPNFGFLRGAEESHFILEHIQNLILLIKKRKENIIQKI